MLNQFQNPVRGVDPTALPGARGGYRAWGDRTVKAVWRVEPGPGVTANIVRGSGRESVQIQAERAPLNAPKARRSFRDAEAGSASARNALPSPPPRAAPNQERGVTPDLPQLTSTGPPARVPVNRPAWVCGPMNDQGPPGGGNCPSIFVDTVTEEARVLWARCHREL